MDKPKRTKKWAFALLTASVILLAADASSQALTRESRLRAWSVRRERHAPWLRWAP
jgi:hypothetical protein